MPAVPKATLSQLNNDSFPNNNLGEITPADLRDFNTAMIASLVDEIPFGTYTASVATSLSALNTYTASQQPTYTALNQFTASQLTINTGVNTFTQSATGRLNNLESTTASLNTWSSSINQIIVNGASIGTSTRFFFNGYVSASIVQNINGPIASITILADQTFTPSASFNAYTASTNEWTASAKISLNSLNTYTASTNAFTASAQTSINQLLTFSSSLDNTYATDAQLAAVSASLKSSINTKLNTSSFNSYTQSVTNTINSFSATTGSYLTTGSASTGSQTVLGDFKFDTTYTANAPAVTQAGGTNILYIDYSIFEGAYATEFNYWNNNGYTGVTVNGTGVTNATVTNTGYGDYLELTLSTGTVTNGATYTFSGPTIQVIDITGSLSVNTQINVSTGNGNTITMDGNGFGANTTTFGGTLNPGIIQLRNVNNNDIFQFAASSSAMYNGGGQWSGPQIAGYTNDLGDASIIGFQTDTSWTDGRVTILRPLTMQSGSVITGSVYGNVISASIASSTASIDLSKASFFTLTLPNGVITNINITNPQPGITALIQITNTGIASSSFSNNVKQVQYNNYTPTSGSSTIDLLSVMSFTSSSVFVTKATNFI
jgi:hypothetical protein